MKKVLSFVLVAVMLLGTLAFAGCGADTYKVGVQQGTTGWSYMSGDADWGFAGFSNIAVNPYENGGLAVKDMLNGNIDFVVIDDAPAKSLVAANSGVKIIDVALTTESYGIGIAKDNSALLAQVNEILAAKQTEIAAIFAKYADVNDDNAGNWSEDNAIVSAEYDASKEQFVVATNAAFAPYEFKVGNKYAGIDMEIAKLVADGLGQELVIMDMEFDAVVASVGKNGVDAAIAGLTINAKRKQSVNFTTPYYSGAYQVILCKSDCTLFDACKTTDDLVAVLNGLKK